MKSMKWRILALAVVLSLTGLLGGCGREPEPTAEVTATAEAPTALTTADATPATTETPVPTPTAMTEPASPTTGLPWEGEYKPVAVVIENTHAARPQSGLSMADFVYEIYVEGKITRLLAVFNDQMPDKVGPVRSMRMNLFDIEMEWGAALAHFGASVAPAVDVEARMVKFDFPARANGLGVNNGLFWRDNARTAPHNAYIDPKDLQAKMTGTVEPMPWQFGTPARDGQDCTTLRLRYNSGQSNTWYEYSAEDNAYKRFVQNGAHKDALTNEQLTVTNIIVQYVDHEELRIDNYVFEMQDYTGTGKADFIMGGKHYTGTWSKAGGDDARTSFFYENGDPLVLIPGNTWVQILYPTTPVYFE